MQADETILKDAFAAALLRQPNDPFRAALQIFGSDTRRALQVSQEWVCDLYVLSKQAELLEAMGEDAFLPNKAMTARRIWDLANTTTDTRDKIAALKLYAEVRSYIEKPGDKINTNLTINQNRVMVIKDHGSDDDWERRAGEQQMKLVADARN
jgi:hypothetical protein